MIEEDCKSVKRMERVEIPVPLVVRLLGFDYTFKI